MLLQERYCFSSLSGMIYFLTRHSVLLITLFFLRPGFKEPFVKYKLKTKTHSVIGRAVRKTPHPYSLCFRAFVAKTSLLNLRNSLFKSRQRITDVIGS
jgi:hypothetical protein